MRLTDLHPKFFTFNSVAAGSDTIVLGFTFDCPHCGKRLSVNFANIIDPQGLLTETNWRPQQPAWNRTGETLENITLDPSIDYSKSGHWHGHIINGEAITA